MVVKDKDNLTAIKCQSCGKVLFLLYSDTSVGRGARFICGKCRWIKIWHKKE
jgi:ribosomal protein S27AE